MFIQKQHVHFIGIGGIGMSGIAEILLDTGYEGLRLRPAPQQRYRPPRADGRHHLRGPREQAT